MTPPPFEPLEILAALEKHRVAYVVIGPLAAILHGTGGTTDEIEICPQTKPANLARLQRALDELGARTERGEPMAIDGRDLAGATPAALRTPVGGVVLVPEPSGTRGGWDDVRRRAVREPLGGGVRAPVAAVEDLIRIAAASGEPAATIERLRTVAERDRGLGRAR